VRFQDLKVEIRNEMKGKKEPAGRPFALGWKNDSVEREG
jgi:hypothetical protein